MHLLERITALHVHQHKKKFVKTDLLTPAVLIVCTDKTNKKANPLKPSNKSSL